MAVERVREGETPSVSADIMTCIDPDAAKAIGAKPRASYVKPSLVALPARTTTADFRHFAARRWAMLHLRAPGFAPLTSVAAPVQLGQATVPTKFRICATKRAMSARCLIAGGGARVFFFMAFFPFRCCWPSESLTALGSFIVAAGSTVVSAVGTNPPHDGVWRGGLPPFLCAVQPGLAATGRTG